MQNIHNRELSWLAFNRRVLQEASDSSVPLLQRLRFLGIYSNNKDEFFRVRIAKLRRLAQAKQTKTKLLAGGYIPEQLLVLVNAQITQSEKEFITIYEQVLEEMEKHHIRVINETMLSSAQEQFCRDYFLTTISTQLVPLFLHKSVTMPFLEDSKPYLAISMAAKNIKKQRFAILPLPVTKSSPRFVQLPSPRGHHDIILQDDIIRLCLHDIFFMFNYDSIQAYLFKIMRDSLLTLDDDVLKSLPEKMEKELEKRLRGKPIRLVYDKSMPQDLLQLIASKLRLNQTELDAGGRYHMMRDLMKFPRVNPALEEAQVKPIPHPDIKPFSSLIKRIAQKDIILSFPYHSFDHVIDFLREAAIDPKVESIAITLYRTAERSKIINALISAAQNGKKVTAVVELLARFNEEQNVESIDILQDAGVQVIHGVKDLKVHSKLILIERKEQGGKLKRYVYVGTGNFNEDTAKTYNDIGILTANTHFGKDARGIFDFLGSMYKRCACKTLITAPYDLRKHLASLIRRETANALAGKDAFIWIKCNNISDEKLIQLLYKASQAGVNIRLIVRSICCLIPQKPGLSENIQAISIVDKYLEHARLMIFHNQGNTRVYIASADLMTRNLDRRLEVAAPILEKKHQKELMDYFHIQWSDTVKARDLSENGLNTYVHPSKARPLRAQTALYDFYQTLNTK